MTILEVLFAILITTVGLLGAIAVFPVASEAARKGRLNDEIAVMGESAAHKFDTMGMRRPDHWIAYVDQSATNQPALRVNGMALPTTYPGTFWKTAFCIDPRFTAANLGTHPDSEQRWTQFPAYPLGASSVRMQRLTLTAGISLVNGQLVPNNPTGPPTGLFQAEHVFSFEDHLVYERPGVQMGTATSNDNSAPAFQILTTINDGTANPPPGKREDGGRLSWMATLVPEIDRNNATTPDKYVLSIVIFDRRSPALVTRDFPAGPPAFDVRDNEWTVSIAGGDFYSGGYGGGEVRLSADSEEKLNIKAGSWVMLSGLRDGPKNASGAFVAPFPAPAFKWYRVSDTGDVTVNAGAYQLECTLVGPDWILSDVNLDNLPDDVEVTVVPGVVQVNERTVRLETDGN